MLESRERKDVHLVLFENIKKDQEIKTYIEKGNAVLGAIGFTEHSFPHAMRTAVLASRILEELGYDERLCELAKMAGYMHDIGNIVNRHNHAQSGALLASQILHRMAFPAEEIVEIVTAIGHHDEPTAAPVTPMTAALILADKSDVRRTRVRRDKREAFDIHDRVNYAVHKSELRLDRENRSIRLKITIDTQQCAVMDYFEIFLERMLLCRKSAEAIGLTFELLINQTKLL